MTPEFPVRRATARVKATTAQVLAVLTDAEALAAWNPALTQVGASGSARVGEPISIRVKGVRGTAVYDRIDRDGVMMTLRIPGWFERGSWDLQPLGLAATAGSATQVTHTFQQSGLLARLFDSATRNVAELRVSRLVSRAEQVLAGPRRS